jgi:hypothetical protein
MANHLRRPPLNGTDARNDGRWRAVVARIVLVKRDQRPGGGVPARRRRVKQVSCRSPASVEPRVLAGRPEGGIEAVSVPSDPSCRY